MLENLTDVEKLILEKIANSDNQVLARRATVILMGHKAASLTEITKTVGLASRTVRHWQLEFLKKRLAIFPTKVLQEHQQTTETSWSSNPKSVKKITKKNKTGKNALFVRKIIGLKPTDTMVEAGRKVLAFHFALMLKREDGTRSDKDIEDLHDMRVATRRMRTTFCVFGEGFSKKSIKPLLAGLKKTARTLGRVRDLDVFIEKMQHYQHSLPEKEQANLQPFLEYCHAEREQIRIKMLVFLDSSKYLKFKKEFLKFVKIKGLGIKPTIKGNPMLYQLRHFAASMVYIRYEAVRAYEVGLKSASLETLHKLRITFKTFRYTMECLQEILGSESETVIKQIKEIQNHLGDLNDTTIAHRFLQDFLNKREKQLTEQQNSAVLNCLQAQSNERQRLISAFPKIWRQFNSTEFRHDLALSVSAL